MYGGKLRIDTPMLYCCGFLLQFLVAGLTGIMLGGLRSTGNCMTRISLLRISTSPSSAALFWPDRRDVLLVPKGKRPNVQRNGSGRQLLDFCFGFNLTFVPLHLRECLACRDESIPTAGTRLGGYNLVASIGVIFQAAG